MKTLASDNYSGVDTEIMQAIFDANYEHAPSYGNDSYTEKAISLMQENFGNDASIYFVYNGTAANTLSLKAMTRNHHAIICTDCSHIVTQEVGAVVNFTGCSLVTVTNERGKLTASSIEEAYLRTTFWGRHSSKPTVVTIAQSTEYGTIYSLEEMRSISAVCKKYNLLFHVDGCRLANAAAALNTTLKEISRDVGVDVLTFGGAKNGLMFGEAIVFFDKKLSAEFEYIHKQGLQLHSKMRFISAQFIPYLEKKIWLRNAKKANSMCHLLEMGLTKRADIHIAYPVETNQLFAYFPKLIIEPTQKIFPYYVWDATTNLVRLVTSFDTTKEEIEKFIELAVTFKR